MVLDVLALACIICVYGFHVCLDIYKWSRSFSALVLFTLDVFVRIQDLGRRLSKRSRNLGAIHVFGITRLHKHGSAAPGSCTENTV